MTVKKDLKFEEKQTFYLKNDIRNLVNFNLNSRKYVMFELKRYRGAVVKNDNLVNLPTSD